MIEPVRSIKKPVFAIALQPVCIVYRSEKLLLFYKRSSLQCTLVVLHSVAGGLPCARRGAAAGSGIWVVSGRLAGRISGQPGCAAARGADGAAVGAVQ